MRIGLLAGAVGLAVGLPTIAKESKIDFREFRADGTPVTPEYPFVDFKAGGAGNATVLDLKGQFASVNRGGGGIDLPLGTMDSGFESLNLLPAELTGQNDTVTWGGSFAAVTGKSVFAAPTAPLAIPRYGVVDETIAGNASKKLRGFVAPPAFGVNQFFGRWVRYDLAKTNTGAGGINTRFVFAPDTGQNVRMVCDTYVTAITSLWTNEPTYVSSGFIIARLLWGGENATSGIGLPIGPIPDFFTLGPNPAAFLTGIFVPCVFPNGHPMAGQNVPVPVGQWFRIIDETDTSANVIHKIDFNMGGPGTEVEIYHALGIQTGRVDRMAFACGMEVDNDACYLDNLHMEGQEFVLPIAPALECASGQYIDNQTWLFPGGLAGQSTRWVDALSSHSSVILDNVPPGDLAIRRTNFFNDDRYRQEIRTLLPLTYASGVGPFNICIAVTMSNSVPAPNATVQSLAPASVTDGDFVTRLFIGRFDPANPPYNARMYVQINADYNPIDDENTAAPYSPGPNGNGGVPILNTDVVDTGVAWVFNAQRNVCFNVTDARALTIQVNGTTIHTGSSFVNSIDQLHLESENNQPGVSNPITYDDVVLTCAVLPPVVLPPFTLVYSDDLEWGILNVTIGAMDDDSNPATPFRWGSVPNMPIVSLTFDVTSKVLKMENLFQDTPAAAPDTAEFASFVQADTLLPHVTASGTRGWVAKADMRLTDAATSRTWSVAQGTISATLFSRCTAITFSSFTGTFWIQVPAPTIPDPFASTWIDSNTTLTGAGGALNQFFGLSTARNLNGEFTYRINGKLLRFTGGAQNGQAVKGTSLSSLANGTHKDMDAMFYLGSDEDTAPDGSILYTDNIKAWSLPCLGDTNNDGVVNFNDLNNVLGFFTQVGPDVTGNVGPDANNDGVPDDNIVNFTDLNLVLSGFGVPCSGN